uniref:Uncharacterized protein n=1 Tax=Cannabis sativa TaxID=3483 RepID=A0A803P8K5_CANSA
MDSEEPDETNDEEYEENQEGYDAYNDGSYTELLTLRQKAADHEVELAAQKEQNRRMQEIMVAMQKAIYGNSWNPRAFQGNPKRIPISFPEKNKKAQDPRKVYSNFAKGKGPQRGMLPRESTGQEREDRKSVSVHQEPGERGRRSCKYPSVDLRQKLNDKHGDLRKHLEKKKQAIPVSKGALNEGILAELAILRKDIARVSRRQKGDDSESDCEDREPCARNILEVKLPKNFKMP